VLRFIATTKIKDSDRLPVISYRFAEGKNYHEGHGEKE
jgi:hypothetical protein